MALASVNELTQESKTVDRDLGRLRKTVGEVLGSVFYGTLLKTMRQSELKGPYGHGGRGEEVFTAQLHGVLAERMGTATSNELGSVLYERLARQQRIISEQRGITTGR